MPPLLHGKGTIGVGEQPPAMLRLPAMRSRLDIHSKEAFPANRATTIEDLGMSKDKAQWRREIRA